MAFSEEKKGYLAAILYSCIIGLSFLVVKTSLGYAGTPVLLAHRFTMALAGALLTAKVRGIDIRVGRGDFIAILPLTIFYPVLFFWLQSAGLEHIPSSVGGILQSTASVFSAILAFFILKEKTGKIQLLGILLTIAGVMLLSAKNGGGSGENMLLGSLLLIGSAFATGFYSVLSRKLSRRFSAFTLTFWMLAVGFIFFNLYAIISSLRQGAPQLYLAPLRHPGYVVAILYLGVLSSLVSSFLSNYALARMEAARMSVFGSLATVISVAAGVVILREPLHTSLMIGMAMIVAGVLLVNRGSKKQ